MRAACPNLEAYRDRGIPVTNTPDVLTNDVADLGVAILLAQSRGMGEKRGCIRPRTAFGQKRLGSWGWVGLAGGDLDNAYSDLSAKDYVPNWTYFQDPVALARHADFLFVTLAASAATQHVVNREMVRAVGPQGMILNISRASNIDEASVLDAGSLGAAALDVCEAEPALNPRFMDLPNGLLQPHHAFPAYSGAGHGLRADRNVVYPCSKTGRRKSYRGNGPCDFTLGMACKADSVTVNMATESETMAIYAADKGSFDVRFDGSGAAPVLAGAIPVMRPGGTVVRLGLGGDTTLPVPAMTAKELSMRGSFRLHEEFHTGVRLR